MAQPTLHLDLIGINVADMGRSLAFYRRLGLDIPADADGQPHVELGLPGGLRLAWDTLDTIRSFDPDYVVPTGSSSISLAFAHDTPADVDATYEKLVAAGYDGHKQPWDAFWGQRYAIVHDPDGNTVDLFAALDV
ncbi:MAG TPA: VOC family protein [Acidimicrobiales bacterium]|jgi:catechol 2,3-dioxygenase-like lactoylglutathione lyase family enzyme|nr:VOC family protein [Acidimicrobiales bacterium]